MPELTEQPKRKLPKWALVGGAAVIAVVALAALGGGSSSSIDLNTATCSSLIPHVVEMSQDRDPKIIEITNPTPAGGRHVSPRQVMCNGSAEWTRGDGSISYGAYESDGGQVILEYQQD